ncbi:MAG: hypothetical protein HRT74_07830, partial [Flavobacteriales bacterium]|nr:hypothetical protein [Flavobacteriales bacterium]
MSLSTTIILMDDPFSQVNQPEDVFQSDSSKFDFQGRVELSDVASINEPSVFVAKRRGKTVFIIKTDSGKIDILTKKHLIPSGFEKKFMEKFDRIELNILGYQFRGQFDWLVVSEAG